MGTAKRAAIYVRVSTEAQEDNTSLTTQEASCRQYAAEHGYEVVGVYADVHSGYDLWERPRLTLLRDQVRRGECAAVIVHALDRLSRKQAHVAIVAEECERANVDLRFVTEEFERSPAGEFMRSARAFAAEIEREKFRERTQRGMRARIASGKLSAKSKPPYGYKFRDESNKGALDIDEAEARIVRQIFTAVATGISMHKVAEQLNEAGVPTSTGEGRWFHGTLRKMLRRDAYIGIARANAESNTKIIRDGKRHRLRVARPESEQIILPQGTIPPIIDEETFSQVQRRLERNKTEAVRNHREPEAFLLRAGYIHCGYCGRALHTRPGYRDSNGKPHRRRYVSTVSHNDTCQPVWIDAEEMDRAVGLRLSALLKNPEKAIGQLSAQASSSAADLATVDRLIEQTERRRTKLAARIAAMDDDDTAEVLLHELRGLQQRHRQLQVERATLSEQHNNQHRREQLIRAMLDWINEVELDIDSNGQVDSRSRRERGILAKAMLDFDAEYPDVLTMEVYNSRRRLLDLFGIDVKIYGAKDTPRWAITVAINVGNDDIVECHSGAGR